MQHEHPPSRLPFLKMHGLGNDFVIFDSRGSTAVVTPELARAIGDRNRGVGFDQLAEIRSSDMADIDLDFWNSDGSRAGACGNATRCVGRLILDETGKDEVTIRTERGILIARRAGDEVSVNMGHPQLMWDEVPLSRPVDVEHLPLDGDPVAVGMGNPHAVFFVKNAEETDVAGWGRSPLCRLPGTVGHSSLHTARRSSVRALSGAVPKLFGTVAKNNLRLKKKSLLPSKTADPDQKDRFEQGVAGRKVRFVHQCFFNEFRLHCPFRLNCLRCWA